MIENFEQPNAEITLFTLIEKQDLSIVKSEGLVPKLSQEKYNSELLKRPLIRAFFAPVEVGANLVQLKITVEATCCLVVDQSLLKNNPQQFDQLVLPLRQFRFGMFQQPQVLLEKTISPAQISLL